MRQLMIFEFQPIGDVVEPDVVIWMIPEPRHQHITDEDGRGLSGVVRHVHTSTERVRRIGEDVNAAYFQKTDISSLTNALRYCKQLGVIRRGETGSVPVIVEVPSMPNPVGRDRLQGEGRCRRVRDNTDALRVVRGRRDAARELVEAVRHEFLPFLIRFGGGSNNVVDKLSRIEILGTHARAIEVMDRVQVLCREVEVQPRFCDRRFQITTDLIFEGLDGELVVSVNEPAKGMGGL